MMVVFGLNTGQTFFLHFFGTSENPLHAPSKHFRFRTFNPVPHDFEQVDHSVHSLQIPFISCRRPLLGRETTLSLDEQGLSGHLRNWIFVPGHEPLEKSGNMEGALSVTENLFSYLSVIMPSQRRLKIRIDIKDPEITKDVSIRYPGTLRFIHGPSFLFDSR